MKSKVPITVLPPLYGAELARRRIALGLTQFHLAMILGMTSRTLQTMEALQKPVMGKSTLIAIAMKWLEEHQGDEAPELTRPNRNKS